MFCFFVGYILTMCGIRIEFNYHWTVTSYLCLNNQFVKEYLTVVNHICQADWQDMFYDKLLPH